MLFDYRDAPVVAVCWWKDMVIGGYGDGTMRVCSSRSGTVLVEVHAHSRWINSIDVARDTGLVCALLAYSFTHSLTHSHTHTHTHTQS